MYLLQPSTLHLSVRSLWYSWLAGAFVAGFASEDFAAQDVQPGLELWWVSGLFGISSLSLLMTEPLAGADSLEDMASRGGAFTLLTFLCSVGSISSQRCRYAGPLSFRRMSSCQYPSRLQLSAIKLRILSRRNKKERSSLHWILAGLLYYASFGILWLILCRPRCPPDCLRVSFSSTYILLHACIESCLKS